MDVVKENWHADFHASPFILFNHKMKKVKSALSVWSKATFRDIFQRLASLEEVVKVHETQFELNPTVQNRERLQRVQAELIRVWALEEDFWKQKAGMAWFKDGDRNTKLFHAHVNGKRKLQLKRIQDRNDNLLEDQTAMAEEVVHFFQQQFHESNVPTDFRILDHVPLMMNEMQNCELTRQLTMEEVKKAVFGLSGDNAGGLDGFNGNFFHVCWEIIGEDVLQMVKAFFCGQELPKFVTHTNLVLLTKKNDVQTFSDLRPISLSNFKKKIISRVIHGRLVDILPNVISDEQAGFVKGRSTVENVMLTQ